MMTKRSSRIRAWLTGGTAALLLGAIPFLLGTTAAQVAPAAGTRPPGKVQATTKSQPQLPETEAEKKDRLYANVPVPTRPGQKQRIYADLSAEEKKRVTIFKNPLPIRRTPTEAQWAEWQNPRKFGIWVDGKRLRGQALSAAYRRPDIVSFSGSYVHKNARQPEGYLYQLALTTERGYEQEQQRVAESPYYGMMVEDQPKSREPRP